MSIFPPLIMAKLWEELKKLAPGRVDTVYLPALMRSASTIYSLGKGPRPRIPFSLCRVILTPGAKKFEQRVGMPIPKFTYMPS
jgi:hypothetical protein